MPPPSRTEAGHLHDVACVAHVHSTHSDGTATVPEIAAAAGAAGARVVLLTDHDSLGARRAGEERYHDGVLVVVGHEVTTRRGHLLVFGLDREIDHRGLDEHEILARVVAGGGVAFAAHPFSEGSRLSRRIGRPHPWRALDGPGAPGIEVWSLVTDLTEDWRDPRAIVRDLRRPETAAAGPRTRNLAAWDRLGTRRRVPAIGGLDAHQHGLRLGGHVISPFPHRRWMRLLQTHLLLDRPLTGDPRDDRDSVQRALRAGRAHMAVPVLGRADGFRFRADRDGERLDMGDEAAGAGWRLSAATPGSADLRLLRDGVAVAERTGDRLEHRAAGPGVYRIEARRDGRPWILSNAIYLRR